MDKRLESEIKRIVPKFLEKSKQKEIQLISHFDTDGITSATIMLQTLQELDRKFTLKIVKSLDENFIKNLNKNKLTLFLDLASGSLNYLKDFKDVFIIDHHEVVQEIPKNIEIINPEIFDKQKISGSGLTYLFCKEINPKNKKFAKLAVLGMVGDCLEKEIGKLNNEILEDGEIKKKRGLLIYPSTRPLNRTLEYSSNPYIPEVTGNIKGVLELLREVGLNPENGKYKSLLELTEEEMQKLTTSIILRNPQTKDEIIGDIFLIKMYNQLEDAREMSAKINACSKYGKSDIALQFCMEIPFAKKRAEEIHAKYKQELISALKRVKELEKIKGEKFLIVNAKDYIKDTMIGTIMSILSNSSMYKQGTILAGLAYYNDKIKVSARNVGKQGRNVRDILDGIINEVGGEVGGHEFAAGCIIEQSKEKEFIELLKKNLEIEMVKISNKNPK